MKILWTGFLIERNGPFSKCKYRMRIGVHNTSGFQGKSTPATPIHFIPKLCRLWPFLTVNFDDLCGSILPKIPNSERRKMIFIPIKIITYLIGPVFHKLTLKTPEMTGINKWNQVNETYVVGKKIKSLSMDCMSRNTFCCHKPLIDCIGRISYKVF